jgi:two-component system, response regulator PdtaR
MACSKMVLVAEDEALIRMMAIDALCNAGFRVLEAQHAHDALALLEAQADGIHLLFTDIHMPGSMDGLDLAHHVHGQWPWIALLIASGQRQPMPAELPPGCRFLPKPYDLDHVIGHARTLTSAG